MNTSTNIPQTETPSPDLWNVPIDPTTPKKTTESTAPSPTAPSPTAPSPTGFVEKASASSCIYEEIKPYLAQGDEKIIHKLVNKPCADRDLIVPAGKRDKANEIIGKLKTGANYCTMWNGDNINAVYKSFNRAQLDEKCKITTMSEMSNWDRCSDGKCCKIIDSKCQDDPDAKKLSTTYIIIFSIIGAIILILLIIGAVYLYKRKSKED